MLQVTYGTAADVSPQELSAFYGRLNHQLPVAPARLEEMLGASDAFVAARVEGQLVGVARGVTDGVRGFLTECKLDPACQGPAAVTRLDGRIEHDAFGIAGEMARRVLEQLSASGAARVDVLAWGTEVDFLEELGFKRQGGMVGMTLHSPEAPAAANGHLLSHGSAARS